MKLKDHRLAIKSQVKNLTVLPDEDIIDIMNHDLTAAAQEKITLTEIEFMCDNVCVLSGLLLEAGLDDLHKLLPVMYPVTDETREEVYKALWAMKLYFADDDFLSCDQMPCLDLVDYMLEFLEDIDHEE